jgi:uncharacterized membrane protein
MTTLTPLGGQILGLPVGSTSPLFLTVLAAHVIAGLACVASGAAAALTRKGPGRHARLGRLYYRGVLVVFTTAIIMAALRWPHDNHLAILAAITLSAAAVGVRARRTTPAHAPHIRAMGASYIALLTAFYVDNGPHLPLWNHLPAIAFWIGPTLIGTPLITRAALHHNRVRVDGPVPE